METTVTGQDPNKCVICAQPKYADGKMCSDCRNKLTELSIPSWVKIFAASVLCLMVIGIIRMPKFLSACMHSARGEKAQKEHRYKTAEKELTYVAAMFPDNVENNARLIICCGHNLDYKGMAEVSQRAADEKSEELTLIDEANDVIHKVTASLPSPKLDSLLARIGRPDKPSTIDSLKEFIALNPDDFFASFILANYYYDTQDWTKTDSITNMLLSKDPENIKALGLMAAIKRENKQYDSAIYFYDKMLEWNAELPEAISGKARVELKRNRDGEAKKFAEESYALDSTNSASLEAMALVDYFSGHRSEANKMLACIPKATTGDSMIAARVMDVLNGKTKYR